MHCPLCGHHLQGPWNDDDPWFCNPKSGGCGASVRGPLEVTVERWCSRCKGMRPVDHEHPQGSLFDAPQKAPLESYGYYDGTPPHEARSASVAAAEEIRPSAKTLRDRVFVAMREHTAGLTDEEGIDITGIAANTYRPRRQELYLGGRIRVNGKRKTRSGRMAQVWEVKG